MVPKILIIDDDRALVDLLRDSLTDYAVVFAASGVGGLHQLAEEKPDLVLLDLKLPDIDGLVVVRKIRAQSMVPIITLSARNEQSDVVMALQAGADDCIRKPFDLDDLEARIGAVLRRSVAPVREVHGLGYRFGSLVIDKTGVATVNDSTLHLTRTEHKLLLFLVTHAHEVVSQEYLYAEVWGKALGQTHTIEVHFTRLKQKLARHPGAPMIANVRGFGFMLQVPTPLN